MRPPRGAPGAIRVSQAWCTIRPCVVNVINRRKPIAIAGAVAEPRRAGGSRLLMRQSVFAEHGSLRSAGAIRYRTTAGSRPPLLCTCVCASQKSLFRRRSFARQHKSGGRRPPVACEHPCSATNARCLPVRFPNHGGLTPAALDAAVGVRGTWFAVPCKCDPFPYHGGLTVAGFGSRFASC
jgi:hypothetical protein